MFAGMDQQSEISICHGPECRKSGGPELFAQLRARGITAATEHCQGLCAYAPVAHIGNRCIGDATLGQITEQSERDQVAAAGAGAAVDCRRK
jgi:NADH:ubiquinone oxidoreductase subunit E